MMSAATPQKIDMTPAPVYHQERIGDTTWKFEQASLNVFDELRLWHENPRILPDLPPGDYHDEAELEAALVNSKGYEALHRSISDMGQLDPIYVWRKDSESEKYIVLEGSTRVTILRDLARKNMTGKKAGKYDRALVKILPPEFSEKERAILLAKIHVRGDGVRAWRRHTQAKFIYDYVEGDKKLMSVTEMAGYMGKSVAWVQRLRDAYGFSLKFRDHFDDDDILKTAMDEFSTLEEISKVTGIGPQLREFDNPKYDQLRDEVFKMVRNGVFSEYRDARFLKQFHDDQDKWTQLKGGEKGIARQLALELKQNGNSVKAKIAALEASVDRALASGDHGLDDEDATHLTNAALRIRQDIHVGVDRFRLALKDVARVFDGVTKADVQTINKSDLDELRSAISYFDGLVQNYGPK